MIGQFRRLILPLIALLFFIPNLTLAGQGPVGLGVVVGSIVGPDIRYAFSKNNFLQGALGWDDGYLELDVDYLWNRPGLLPLGRGHALDLYFGVGGWLDQVHRYEVRRGEVITDKTETELSVRVPVGVKYNFKDPTFEIFLDIGLNLRLVPDTNTSLNALTGGRYVF